MGNNTIPCSRRFKVLECVGGVGEDRLDDSPLYYSPSYMSTFSLQTLHDFVLAGASRCGKLENFFVSSGSPKSCPIGIKMQKCDS